MVELASRGELMKTTANIRFASLAGLVLLSLLVLVLAAGAQIAPAASGDGAGASGTTAGDQVPPAQLQAASVKHDQIDRIAAYGQPTADAPADSSGGISTTTWVIIAVVVAMLAIGAWVLLRQRSRPGRAAAQSPAFCSLHPEDVRCAAG
jgi:hypothetical protein